MSVCIVYECVYVYIGVWCVFACARVCVCRANILYILETVLYRGVLESITYK